MSSPFATLNPEAATATPAEPPVTFDPEYTQEVLKSSHENVTDKIFIVDFKVPPFRQRKLQNPATEESYVQIGWATAHLKFINVYCYFDPKWLKAGSVVRAAATIRKKVRDDGKEFLYVEIRPTSEELTHRMFVGGDKALKKAAENAEIFRAYDPIPGGITMTPVPQSGSNLANLFK